MPDRLIRVDRGVATLSVYDSEEDRPLASPGHAPAWYHPDGYLIAEALIARDGLLEYSDGRESWLEYRPREELVAAASTWAHTPVTDDHPAKMVSSDTWDAVARGIITGPPKVVDYKDVAYLQATLIIASAELLKKVEALRADGKPVQLSIGFTTLVIPKRGIYRGREYDAVHTRMLGNHAAVIDIGRAGPDCRVLLDGAYQTLHHGDMMNEKPKKDAEGAPVDVVEVQGPSGPEMVSTWIAAELEQLQALRAAQSGPPALPAPAPAPALPAAAPVDATAAPAALPAPVAPEEEAGAGEEEEDTKMDAKERRRLERCAEKLGADDAKLDAMDDLTLSRYVVAEKLGLPEESLKQVKGDSLRALVDSAIAKKEVAPDPVMQEPTPWGQGVSTRGDGVTVPDAQASSIAAFMASQGY